MYNLALKQKLINLEKKINTKKNIRQRQYLPSIREWNNSIYNFNNNIIKTLHIKDKFSYKLFNSYFNLKKIKKLKNRKFSIIKVFISKLDIKHSNSSVYISLCLFNKEKISFKTVVFNLYKKILNKKLKKFMNELEVIYLNYNQVYSILSLILNYNKNKKKLLFKLKKLKALSLKYNKKDLLLKFNDLAFKYKKLYVLKIKYVLKKYKYIYIKKYILKKKYKNSIKKNFFKKKYIYIRLKFINYKYNINNLSGVKNILYKIYNKKIHLNVINLKHIYLDSNILTEAVGAKLKNRKANLLKTIVKSIYSVKIPNIDITGKIYNLNLNNIILMLNPKIILKNDICTIKDLFFIYKQNIAFYKLKNKTIKGIKIQGTGRLTKRLTALRSISKFKQKGSLKNIYSSHYNYSSIMLLGYMKSNIQFIKKNYNNRNGSYGIKTHISSC